MYHDCERVFSYRIHHYGETFMNTSFDGLCETSLKLMVVFTNCVIILGMGVMICGLVLSILATIKIAMLLFGV